MVIADSRFSDTFSLSLLENRNDLWYTDCPFLRTLKQVRCQGFDQPWLRHRVAQTESCQEMHPKESQKRMKV